MLHLSWDKSRIPGWLLFSLFLGAFGLSSGAFFNRVLSRAKKIKTKKAFSQP